MVGATVGNLSEWKAVWHEQSFVFISPWGSTFIPAFSLPNNRKCNSCTFRSLKCDDILFSDSQIMAIQTKEICEPDGICTHRVLCILYRNTVQSNIKTVQLDKLVLFCFLFCFAYFYYIIMLFNRFFSLILNIKTRYTFFFFFLVYYFVLFCFAYFYIIVMFFFSLIGWKNHKYQARRTAKSDHVL